MKNKILKKLIIVAVLADLLSMLILASSTIYTNSQLTLKGSILQEVLTEQNKLIEANRELEKNISELESVSIITSIAEKRFNLERVDEKNIVQIADKKYANL